MKTEEQIKKKIDELNTAVLMDAARGYKEIAAAKANRLITLKWILSIDADID